MMNYSIIPYDDMVTNLSTRVTNWVSTATSYKFVTDYYVPDLTNHTLWSNISDHAISDVTLPPSSATRVSTTTGGKTYLTMDNYAVRATTPVYAIRYLVFYLTTATTPIFMVRFDNCIDLDLYETLNVFWHPKGILSAPGEGGKSYTFYDGFATSSIATWRGYVLDS